MLKNPNSPSLIAAINKLPAISLIPKQRQIKLECCGMWILLKKKNEIFVQIKKIQILSTFITSVCMYTCICTEVYIY